jgi:predicted ATPase
MVKQHSNNGITNNLVHRAEQKTIQEDGDNNLMTAMNSSFSRMNVADVMSIGGDILHGGSSELMLRDDHTEFSDITGETRSLRAGGSSINHNSHSGRFQNPSSDMKPHSGHRQSLYKDAKTSRRASSLNVLENLSINKLNFEKAGLHGRQKETDLLKQIWSLVYQKHKERKLQQREIEVSKHLCDQAIKEESGHIGEELSQHATNTDSVKQTKPPESSSAAPVHTKVLTVVEGLSGVGKSKLVSEILQKEVERKHGFFVTGKFDLKQFDVPFNGMIMAVDDLCDKILASINPLFPRHGDTSGSLQPLSSPFTNDDGGSTFTLANGPVEFDDIREFFKQELKLELPFLIHLFPKLLSIVGHDYAMSVAASETDSMAWTKASDILQYGYNQTDEEALATATAAARSAIDIKANADRLRHCFRKFIHVVCSYRPLVIFCDDTHWADQESLDLLFQLLTDKCNQDTLLVVCTYRSNEVDEEHKMTKFLHQVQALPEAKMMTETESITKEQEKSNQESSSSLLSTTRAQQEILIQSMKIDNLSVNDVNLFLVELLSTDPEETISLAQILYQKTQGNAFFVVQLLMAMQEQGLLAYNLGMMKWVWDDHEIQDSAPTAENVVVLVMEKLKNDPEAKQLLPIAACIGATFDAQVLTMLVDGFRADENSACKSDDSRELHTFLALDFDVRQHLKECVSEGYIQRNATTDGYQFIHDRIQEAALAACPENMRNKLKYKVGTMLAKELPDNQVEAIIFSILGLLKADGTLRPKNDDMRMFYMNLHIMAGKKALAYSAFKPAKNYLEAAISMLPNNPWQECYGVTLDLYTLAAEAEYSVANFDGMQDLIHVILQEPSVLPHDKLSVVHILIDSGVACYQPQAAIKTTLRLLSKCGLKKFPRSNLRVSIAAAAGLMRTKLSKQMKNPRTIADLRITADSTHAAVMRTLDHLATAAYVSQPQFFPVVVLRSIRYTFENGITLYSPAAFALNGLLLSCFMDDFASGWSFTKNALSMLQRLKCKEVESRVYFVAYTYPAQWIKPMQDCMKPLLKGYEIGLSTGDLQSALYCALFYCEYAFYTGMPLALVDDNMKMYSDQMADFGHHSLHRGVKMLHQAVRILRNEALSNDGIGAILTGDVMDQEEMIKEFRNQNDEFYISALQRYRPILACYVGDYESGADLAIEWTEKCCKTLPGQPVTVIVRFCSAVCCYAMARKTKKKKYLKEAKKHHKLLRSWSERSKSPNPNAVHREVLLSAEADAAKGKIGSALKKYESAILMAGRRGIIQDQALANERFACLCLEQGDKEEYYFRLNTALRLYAEWGAALKVKKLKESLRVSRRLSEENKGLVGYTIQTKREPLQPRLSSIRYGLDEEALRELEAFTSTQDLS